MGAFFRPTFMRRAFLVIFILLLLGSAGSAIYFRKQVMDLQGKNDISSLTEAKAVVERVSRLIILPEDEEPTVATVSDPEKLRGQMFFSKAKQGDKVLIYAKSRKAILYDPVQNKIVEVAPINIGSETETPAPSEIPIKEEE